jgi:two-component system, OmpR family, sensor kinase
VSRIPIRLRLTLAFALAMALVLAGIGSFLVYRLGTSLDEAVNEGLQGRAAELAPRVARATGNVGSIATLDLQARFVQVLDERGAVVGQTEQVGTTPVLELATARRLARSSSFADVDDVPGLAEPVRIAARTVSTPAGDRVLVVGSSLDDRDETVRRFVLLLILVAPVALVLTSLLGYGIATAALRPVDAMRVEAEAISAAEPERRLPLSPAHDEIRRLGVTLNQMLERLGDALERERRFVADASHELRTPLALLETELELALRQPRSHAELEGAVRSAAEESDRLVRLAEDLLVVASADRGTLPIRRTREAAAALVEEVAARFRIRASSAERRVEAGAPADLEVDVDGVRIRQALGNLVDNALRHGSGTVGVHAERRDGRIELHVTDEGDGFGLTFLPRAFERFSRDDEARAPGGAGLGLSIVEAIARAHGGSVGASNRPTGGADVWLTLPTQPEAAK